MATRFDDVYTLLEDRLMRGHYLPNETLSDSALSKELHVSRNPIRRAMEQLQAQGFLSSTPHQSKLVIGYRDDESIQLYTYILHLVELALFHPPRPLPNMTTKLTTLKQLRTPETFFDYAQQLAFIYRSLVAVSDNDIYVRSFDQWHKPFIRMLTLRFRLGELTQPFHEVEQLTQLFTLIEQQQFEQAQLYMRCIVAQLEHTSC